MYTNGTIDFRWKFIGLSDTSVREPIGIFFGRMQV
jgi:hypothetical protein